ncbi:MAG: T9SS type A sorting domain-containing protein [Bacteroidia bacterium]
MRILTTILFLTIANQSFSQIGLGFYDLPYWGDTYYRNNVIGISSAAIPQNVYDTTSQEQYWDLSGITGETDVDTSNYFWVEGTPAAFDFPDANMADYDPNDDNGQYMYFIKDETGFYFSGQSGGLATEMGDFDIKAEFRPAVPLVKVPARLGDNVSEVSRASVDLLTFGKVKLATTTEYTISGYGTVKIPGGEEFEVLRFNRVTESEVIFSINLGGQTIEDTTTTLETTWEFYTSGYGDAVATITKSFDEMVGLDQYSFAYKKERIKSSIASKSTTKNMSVFNLPSHNALIVKDVNLEKGGIVELYNINGQCVYHKSVQSSALKIETQTFNKGVYIIKTQSNNGIVESKTVIINR